MPPANDDPAAWPLHLIFNVCSILRDVRSDLITKSDYVLKVERTLGRQTIHSRKFVDEIYRVHNLAHNSLKIDASAYGLPAIPDRVSIYFHFSLL
jgi:hypothetical protein